MDSKTPFEISSRKVGDVAVVVVVGEIRQGTGSFALKEALRDLLMNGQRKILLNLGQCTYIDSPSFGELISGDTAIKQVGGAMVFCALQGKPLNAVRLSKLDERIPAYETEEEALTQFG